MDKYSSYVNGEWVREGEEVENLNPSDLSDVIGLSAWSGQSLANDAIAVARQAAIGWEQSSIQDRSEILEQVAYRLREGADQFGSMLSREQGKPIAEGRAEVQRAAKIFSYFAAEAVRLQGECGASVRSGVDVRVDRFAVGVIGIITPWNFPIAIPAWKIAPALAFGNTVVFKPAGITPACANLLAELLDKAGLPAGVFNLVHGAGSVVGNTLIASPDVDAISFTGSDGVGRAILSSCSKTGKKCQLELGGKNPLIIADDADIDQAVSVAANGAFGGNGQKCTASSRIIVMHKVYEEFTDKLTAHMNSLKVGHALDEGTDIGPVADKGQYDSVRAYIDLAREEGAVVLSPSLPEMEFDGFYVPPALFVNAQPDYRTSKEEIFGPCASVFVADEFEQAIEMANDTPFGLSSGLCTTSLARTEFFRRRTKSGLAMINLPTAGVDYHVPFGGIKASGHGPKEQGPSARDFYTELKVSYVKG